MTDWLPKEGDKLVEAIVVDPSIVIDHPTDNSMQKAVTEPLMHGTEDKHFAKRRKCSHKRPEIAKEDMQSGDSVASSPGSQPVTLSAFPDLAEDAEHSEVSKRMTQDDIRKMPPKKKIKPPKDKSESRSPSNKPLSPTTKPRSPSKKAKVGKVPKTKPIESPKRKAKASKPKRTKVAIVNSAQSSNSKAYLESIRIARQGSRSPAPSAPSQSLPSTLSTRLPPKMNSPVMAPPPLPTYTLPTPAPVLPVSPVPPPSVNTVPPLPEQPSIHETLPQLPINSKSLSVLSTGEKRVGRFSLAEKRLMHDALMAYIELNKHMFLGDTDGLQALCNPYGPNRKFRGAWPEIAKCIPDRSVISVYQYCVRTFGQNALRKGPWDAEEVNRLRELVTQNGHCWSKIGKELGRLPCGCRDKWRLVENSHQHNKGPWSAEEDEKLIALVRESSPGDEPPKSNILWTTIAQKFATRPPSACRNRWYDVLYLTLSQKDSWDIEDDRELILNVCKSGARDACEVPWGKVSSKQLTTRARKRWDSLVHSIQKQYECNTFADQLARLCRVYKVDRADKSDPTASPPRNKIKKITKKRIEMVW